MEHGQLLLSKVLDENDTAAFKRHAIDKAHFPTEGERQAFEFIRTYAEQNRGQAPDYREVIAACPAFDYRPQVESSYEWLAKQLKSAANKRQIVELIGNGETQRKLDELDGDQFIEYLQAQIDDIKTGNSVKKTIGKTLTEIKQSFREEYENRESGKSFKSWKTPFDTFTREIGEWYSGDVYGIMAESGRGKTYLIIRILDSLLRQGAKVLVKSFEVKEYTFIARLVSIITAIDETFIDNLGQKVGIPNKQILGGKLTDIVRDKFFEVVEALDEYYPGTLYFQGKSSNDLTRTLNDLDRELSSTEVDAVFLDPFYGLADVYGKNANKTSGGAAEQAATRFENIIGDHDVVGFYTVQSTVDKPVTGEDGSRELELPTRDQVKTTKRLLDIATILIGFDSIEKEGIAKIGISKGRNGGEDFELDLIAMFDVGVLKEITEGGPNVQNFGF